MKPSAGKPEASRDASRSEPRAVVTVAPPVRVLSEEQARHATGARAQGVAPSPARASSSATSRSPSATGLPTASREATLPAGPEEAPPTAPTTAPGPEPRPSQVDPRQPMFRERALNAYLRGHEVSSVLRVTSPSTWVLFAALAAMVVTGLGFCVFGRVEITARGPGVLRTQGGVRDVHAQIAGRVLQVHVRSGQRVNKGDPLITLDATEARAALLEAETRFALVDDKLKKLEAEDLRLAQESQQLLERERRLLGRRIASSKESVRRTRRRLAEYRKLRQEGLVERALTDNLRDQLSQARANLLHLQEERVRIDERMRGATRQDETQRFRWLSERAAAQASLEAAQLRVAQLVIRASAAGVVEAVVVQPGELVHPALLVGKLVADGKPQRAIGFVAERDRAFLVPGAAVRLEVDQLPVSEFGAVQAQVARVSNDIASPEELSDALGAGAQLPGPHYRVELDVIGGPSKVMPRLRSGMVLQARYSLRERPVIALMFDPIRKWLE